MLTPPTAPSPGKPVSAGFFAALIRWIKSVTLVDGPGYRLSRGPNGTTISFATSRTSSSARLPGLFEPRIEQEQGGAKTVRYTYPYFMVGTRLYRCEDEDVTISCDEGIHCLVIDLDQPKPKGTVEVYADFGEVQAAAEDISTSVKPLFEFDADGNIIRDCRNMPTIATQEFA